MSELGKGLGGGKFRRPWSIALHRSECANSSRPCPGHPHLCRWTYSWHPPQPSVWQRACPCSFGRCCHSSLEVVYECAFHRVHQGNVEITIWVQSPGLLSTIQPLWIESSNKNKEHTHKKRISWYCMHRKNRRCKTFYNTVKSKVASKVCYPPVLLHWTCKCFWLGKWTLFRLHEWNIFTVMSSEHKRLAMSLLKFDFTLELFK